MFRAFCLKYLLNERYNVSFIERLKNSGKLRELCGFDDIVPSASAFSRFFRRLTERVGFIEGSIAEIINHIHSHLPDMADSVAIDATDIPGYANPNRSAVIDQDAEWGIRTTKNKSSKPTKAAKPKEYFFGYKLHLLGDVKYGVPLTYTLTPANIGDTTEFKPVLDKAVADYRWFQPEYCIADRGYDSFKNHRAVLAKNIKPIIHIRRPTGAKPGKFHHLHHGIYSTIGEPTCVGGKVMDYKLTNPDTGDHLYQCPAGGCSRLQQKLFPPPCRDAHWESPKNALRVISTVARASDEWKRMYKKRTVVERTFSSLKRSRLLDQHQYLTQGKVRAHVALSMLTYVATMLAHTLAGDVEGIRWMRLRV